MPCGCGGHLCFRLLVRATRHPDSDAEPNEHAYPRTDPDSDREQYANGERDADSDGHEHAILHCWHLNCDGDIHEYADEAGDHYRDSDAH